VDQKVDVISISWITRRKSAELNKAIRHAARKKVLVFCSTADTGVNYGKVWPADSPSSISVSASDTYGRPRPQSREKADLLVSGEDVIAEGPAYIKKYTKGPVSGSSVATALAAGMASLALTLARLANSDEKHWRKFQDKAMMLKVFDLMRDKKQKSLQPGRLFKAAFAPADVGGVDATGNPTEAKLPKWTELLNSRNFEDLTDVEDDEDEENSSDAR
jgi:hypothetical protein